MALISGECSICFCGFDSVGLDSALFESVVRSPVRHSTSPSPPSSYCCWPSFHPQLVPPDLGGIGFVPHPSFDAHDPVARYFTLLVGRRCLDDCASSSSPHHHCRLLEFRRVQWAFSALVPKLRRVPRVRYCKSANARSTRVAFTGFFLEPPTVPANC